MKSRKTHAAAKDRPEHPHYGRRTLCGWYESIPSIRFADDSPTCLICQRALKRASEKR